MSNFKTDSYIKIADGVIYYNVQNMSDYNLNIGFDNIEDCSTLKTILKETKPLNIRYYSVSGESIEEDPENPGQTKTVKHYTYTDFENIAFDHMEISEDGDTYIGKYFFRIPNEIDELKAEIADLKALILQLLK